ncbi:MAG: sigma-70 family RNA polymerase sigma factor [Actinobacteria bacterium]|nr:sigma-70 family RNA polymerase sigma factor [Actinomycetota bacterium]
MLSDRLRAQPSEGSSPDFAETVAERQQVVDALSLLSPLDQEAMKLVGWDDLSIAEAAVVLGCSRAALAVRLHRARQKVRRALTAAGSEPSGYADSPSAIMAKGL